MAARGLTGYGCTGTLTIDGVLLNTPAWDATDLTTLWVEASVRGGDRLLPGVAGVIPYRRRLDVTEYALPMLVSGDVDENGDDYADAWVGLETNLQWLWSNVVEPTNTGDGTRPATLTMPSGLERVADVHVLGLRVSSAVGAATRNALVRAVLQISVPAGRFEFAGS